MATPIHVTDDLGNSYMVDPALLSDPTEAALPDQTIQLTADNQVYQKVGGQWYRVLRADKVSWITDIKPTIGVRGHQMLPFVLGQAQGYTP